MKKWIPAVLVLGTLMFSIGVYGRLPERMVIHWGASGEPNGYASRAFGTFFMPILTLVLWGIFTVLPRLDPRRQNIEQFRDAYEILIIAVVGLMSVLHVAVLGFALGWPVHVERVAPVGIGVLFVVLGALLPRFRSNFFFGIRTPWTLSSEMVWARTHRVGGSAMVGIGILFVVMGLTGWKQWFWVVMAGSLVMGIGVLVYSYVIWRDEQRGH